MWVQGSGPVCVARRAVKVRGRPTFRECRANKTEDSSWRLEDKEKREESLSKTRGYSTASKAHEIDKKALGGLTVNSPGTGMAGPAQRGRGQGLGRAYLHRWTDFLGASWHRSRPGRASSSQGRTKGALISRPWGAVGCGQMGAVPVQELVCSVQKQAQPAVREERHGARLTWPLGRRWGAQP